ncbi:MAG: hypothetical protein LQ339_002974 [Xanthoria mediterranea]|nr:MAG: hypothetical protein LQ339_002974 [Xanthoria mediterranea]
MGTSETAEDLKRCFFQELYELDVSDESVNDVGTVLAAFRAAKPKPKARPLPQAYNRPRANLQHLGRTVSAPTPTGLTTTGTPKPLSTGSLSDAGDKHSEAVRRSPVAENFQSKTVADQKPTQMAPGAKGKRKRGRSLEVLPEAQQIFRGLRFYFLPDDDVAPARKLRIAKVLERGAMWIKEWTEDITHIIVDRNLTYADLLKYLKRSSIPANMAVVNEHYPAECIQYRTLVNPDQILYHVRGCPPKVVTEQKDRIADPAVDSLPLKNESRANADPSPTSSSTDTSEQLSAPCHTAVDAVDCTPSSVTHAPDSHLRNGPADALDEVIEELLAVKDLPLDDEDFGSPSSTMAVEGSDDDDRKGKLDKRSTRIPSFDKSRQAKFSCMEKHTGTEDESNPNARTIEVLKQMMDYYDRTNEHWKTIAYRKAIAALKKQTRKITTKEEALAIPFIGSRLAVKIEEIVFTNRLRRLENTNFDSADIALQLFLKIYGVGHSQASLWINQGYRTLNDLLTKATLTTNQKIGIEHIDDFATRIPRDEVEHHGRIVRNAIHKEDPAIEITIGGSYRRGAPDSGDVDFIITKPDASMETLRTIILDTVIPSLFQQHYLRHALASSTSRSDGSKWHGCATLPGSKIWHRIDFLLVPHAEMGAALIYFTGNDIFNRSIRLLASRKGMRLNQRGLWKDVLRGGNRERMTQGALLESRDERKVFGLLGVPWRPPEHRVC